MKIVQTQFKPNTIQLGISACVVGQGVRFDGGHKRLGFADRELREYVSYVPVCPEVAIGLSVPRPTIRQVEADNQIRVVGSTDKSIDVTDDLHQYSEQQAKQLSGLSGFIVCAKSPSCGMERIKVYHPEGHTLRHDSVGVFTKALMEKHPLLPVEENGRLCDPVLRENFVTRVFAYHAWQQLVASGLTSDKLIKFHSRYKFLVMANHQTSYRTLGQLISDLSSNSLDDVADEYITGLMYALKQRAGRKGHTNALMHLQGYFKRSIGTNERQALADVIDKYRQGILPLMAPMTLIQHLLVKFPNEYLSQQVYIKPHPEKLALRQQL
ncbi:DUF523 and DUF1722 domain-containing protein [Neiella marina]|uniref:DUF523 and DUF1722 domain-containing protein n=1 Tax=Neiella holothuriorum TaxID=2870530 RepID=A0ABS7EJU4_9GAMM|nr:DUF523 and DUF1722 domain-containing protein [Neiella holothuriorum]MBW8191932.1 DUF523 and DUF1722 domain-containing protein [Neiella holothuriorum]